MVVAIIPVRGGSKRVPRKNVKSFCGHPLMAWTIAAAKCSHLVDKVLVTTDDDEMENIAQEYGADEILRRPYWPDADAAAGNRPILHATEWLCDNYGDDWTHITLFATSPQRLPADIDRAVNHFYTTGLQRVVGMSRKRETFIFRQYDGYVESVIRDKYRQHFEQTSGLVSVTSARHYRWLQSFITDDTDAALNKEMKDVSIHEQFGYIETEPWQVPETDMQNEFELCELIMDHYVLKGRGMGVYYDYAGEKQ